MKARSVPPRAQQAQIARSDWTYSFRRGAGADHGTEKRRSLWPFTWLPRPSTKRPFDAACRSHDASATTIGLRGKAMATPVASCTRSVVVVAMASGRNGSLAFSCVTTAS